jgi:hypothetical protein
MTSANGFDEKAAKDELVKRIHELLPEIPERINAVQSVELILDMLRWQHEKDRAKIEELEKNLEWYMANSKTKIQIRDAWEKVFIEELSDGDLIRKSDLLKELFGDDRSTRAEGGQR